MIEKMKSVCIVTSANSKETMLNSIRDLGVLHINEKKPADVKLSERFDNLSKNYLLLKEMPGSSNEEKALSEEKFEALNSSVNDALQVKKSAEEERSTLALQAERLKAWGDFSPEEIIKLKEQGFELHFYRMGKKELAMLSADENIKYIKLGPVEKMETVAVVGKQLAYTFPANEFEIPELGLAELNKKIAADDSIISRCNKTLNDASKQLKSYEKFILDCQNCVEYSSVSETSLSEDGLVWLTGYIPSDDEEKFISVAKENKWAYLLDDPSDEDEHVPTKVKYSKVTRLMKPVFDILGTVPGYHEYDISFPFLCFFALFFAMIIGDAGYGFCFLLIGILLHIKQKKASELVLLVYVMSITTIAWGAVTGTWFGLEGAMNIPALKALVIKELANYPQAFNYDPLLQQNNIMKFCFMTGTIQLTLACVINIVSKIKSKNLSLIADMGWLCSINALYYVVLLLVIGADVKLGAVAPFIGLGFLLVVVFGGMSPDKTFAEGLKAGLADAFTSFLNTISAFGNIMSYIRLFAVGMASLAIAQSFNNMALGFTGWLRIAGIIIFIIGHVLNLVMGLLSVVVHGIRLNLLEFSGQLGMEWSGVAYNPFKKQN